VPFGVHLHPPVAPPPIVGSAGAPPTSPPPAAPPTGRVADRRTSTPYVGDEEQLVAPSDEGYALDEYEPDIVEGGAYDVWQDLLTSYLDTRNVGVSDVGEAYPETAVGDVKRAMLVLSRELCRPRYDFANLIAARAAWNDAVARATAVCSQLSWNDLYPENERFWLSDALALAQRLAVVDTRRNAIVEDHQGLIRMLGERTDALTTWNDLRHFLMRRRSCRVDGRGMRYPEATIGDVLQVTQILDEELHRVVELLGDAEAPYGWYGTVRGWREALARVGAAARGRVLESTYIDNERFWRDSKRFAIRLSAYRDLLAAEPRAP
jgi:hypothetical protein